MNYCIIVVIFSAAFSLTLSGAMAAAAPPSYKVTILYAGATANGVSGSTQVGEATVGLSRALLWNGTPASVVNLHPAGFSRSAAFGASGSSQVGVGYNDTPSFYSHALLWHGTASSIVDLHPAGFDSSVAVGVSGEFQVGAGDGPGFEHALLWNGSKQSVVDLNPAGFTVSTATSISGMHQVGVGCGPITGGDCHALLWSGTAASVVDLNPAGFMSSDAHGVASGIQVGRGYATIGGEAHALLWSNTAASAVDLNPAGYTSSEAFGVAAGIQIGRGYGPATSGQTHALLWSGTAASVVDLHSFLTGLGHSFDYSQANAIDANGSIVGYASDNSGQYALLWTPIPEPSTLALVGLAAVVALTGMQRSRCHRWPQDNAQLQKRCVRGQFASYRRP